MDTTYDNGLINIFLGYNAVISAGDHWPTERKDGPFTCWRWGPGSVAAVQRSTFDIGEQDLSSFAASAKAQDPNDADKVIELFKAWADARVAVSKPALVQTDIDDALNRLFKFANICGPLQPHAR